MTSSECLFDMYDIKKASSPIMTLIHSMLYTLNTNNLLTEAVDDINRLTDLDMQSNQTSRLQSGAQIPEMIGLSGNTRALLLAIELYPYIKTSEGFTEVTLDMETLKGIFNLATKRHNYSQLKKALQAINGLNLGYKVVQKHRDNPFNLFYIILYDSKEELLQRLKDNKLLNPGILDKLLTHKE